MDLYNKCLQSLNMDTFLDVNKCKTSSSICNIGDVRTTAPKLIGINEYEFTCRKVYYISDIHLEHQIIKAFPSGTDDNTVETYIKSIARGVFSEEFIEDIADWRQPIVLFAGDTGSNFNIVSTFYKEFVEYWDKLAQKALVHRSCKKYIYAILGNHELWDFDTLDNCYNAYKEMFSTLGIHFLNNSVTWFGEHRFPIKMILDDSNKTYHYEEIDKDNNPDEYRNKSRYLNNIIITGGIGFAGYNYEFNANNGIYRNVVSREQEIEETNTWESVYNKAVSVAKENNCPLIVLTHNPITDWKKDNALDYGCVYFNGHDHRNYIYHDDECDIHILANNQIGYKNNIIKLVKAYIYERVNPFAGYPDGCHEINSFDYIRFYDYIGERIKGSGLIDKQIKNNNARLYLIKHNNYYGFFLTSLYGVYICAGGRIKKISKYNDIKYYSISFSTMIDTYLNILSPYRNVQEQISKVVKSFGGDGSIHGCIIDIDFLNHIMLNPSDGTITYYYSPVFGIVQTYDNILGLLSEHNKELENAYRNQLKLAGDGDANILVKSQIDITGELTQIDIKNSIYSISNRMNQLQRLFDKGILRDWNDELLYQKQKEIKKLK